MRRASATLALCGLTAACASAPTTIYTLEPAPPAAAPAGAYAGPPLRVDAVHVPPTLDRPELVTQAAPGVLRVRDLARWAAPLGELSRRALTQDLLARLPPGAVLFPDSPKPPGARGLVVDLLAVSPSSDGTTLEASWTLLPAARGGALRQRQARLSTPATGGPGGEAADLSALLGRLADAIAADLASAPPQA